MYCITYYTTVLHRGLITIVRLLGGAGGRSNSSSSSNNTSGNNSGNHHNSSSGYMHSDDGGVQDIILDTFIEILAPVSNNCSHYAVITMQLSIL
jgi:hypothetical protein